MANNENKELQELMDIIGYRFKNEALLQQALTHSSYSGEKKTGSDYERIEFLGDAVLELLTSEYLYHKYGWTEGELTKHRAEMVCEPSLAWVARQYGFGRFLRLNYGEEKTGGRDRSSILCDVTEAIIGAVYLDSGLEEAKALVKKLVFAHEAELPGEKKKDSKTLLQEYVQTKGTELPAYQVISEAGEPHCRIFTVELSYGGKKIARAQGKSKKEAEQNAAALALDILKS